MVHRKSTTMSTTRREFLSQSFSAVGVSLTSSCHESFSRLWYRDTLYARALPKKHYPAYRYVLCLNSKGLGRKDRYHVYEPTIEAAFQHLRLAAEKWDPRASDPEVSLSRFGIELVRVPKFTYPGTYGSCAAYAKDLRAIHSLQIVLTKIEAPTRVVIL